MAIDQFQLLQMLLQGGGSPGGSPQPTSGLQDPSLSGLMLGPQGMGFGGGESLMGGGPAGGGGSAGGGLGGFDLAQLISQLPAAPGVTGAGLATGIGLGSLGGGGSFGAGGLFEAAPGAPSLPTAGQQGQAGLGTANTTAQLLGLLKEGTSLGKALTDLFPKGPTTTDLAQVSQAWPDMPPDVQAALAGVTPIGGVGSVPSGNNAFNLNLLMTPEGSPTFLGPGGAPALPGELGPAGGPVGGGPSGLGTIGAKEIGGGLGLLGSLFGAGQGFAAGNTGQGIAGLGSAGLNAAVLLNLLTVPEAFGAGLPLAAASLPKPIGMFGPYATDYQLFPGRAMETQQKIGMALQDLFGGLGSARTQGDLSQLEQNFADAVRLNAGVGNFGWGQALPEVGPVTHGVSTPATTWNPQYQLLQQLLSGLGTQLDPGASTIPSWLTGFQDMQREWATALDQRALQQFFPEGLPPAQQGEG